MTDLRKCIVYRNLKEMVEPEHTALVVWDVQNRLVNMIFNKEEFTQNLKGLIKQARNSNIPIIYSKIFPVPKEYESSFRTYLSLRRIGADDPKKLANFMQPGSPEAEIYSEVAPLDTDVVIDKPGTSFFIGTNLDYMLRNRGITTILWSGISTEHGISSSARDSACRGFYTIVVDDCVSSSDKEMHESALRILEKVCVVASSKDIISEWK